MEEKIETLRARLRALLSADPEDATHAELQASAAALLADLMGWEERAKALFEGGRQTGRVSEEAPRYGSRVPGIYEGLPLHEAARRALERAGMPLHVRDLGARIKAGGWRHPRAKDAPPEQIQLQLAARLPTYPEMFRRVEPNTFGLAEWPEPEPGQHRRPSLGYVKGGKGEGLARLIGEHPEMILEGERSAWRSS